jgi:hypothetical protein
VRVADLGLRLAQEPLDQARLGEIRRGVLDNMLSSIENTGAVDAAGELLLSQAKTAGFLRNHADVLKASGSSIIMSMRHCEVEVPSPRWCS